MAEKDLNQRPDVQAVDYAFWQVPGREPAFRIIYSLPLFHEIDFVVNEGYRKIPHGGIEVAGLLFGTVGPNEVRIETFRPIVCEHAAGPSLNFSVRDLAALETQIQASMLDKDLEKFQVIGWFLGHSRNGLELTDSEAIQCDRFFRGSHKVALIVKPERFQPTRFAFLVRNSDGEMPRDASSLAIILPLPGRTSKPGQISPSIAAPDPNPTLKPAAIRPAFVQPANVETAEAGDDPKGLEAQLPEIRSLSQQQERRRLARERVRLIEEAFPTPTPDEEPALKPVLEESTRTALSEITLAPPALPKPQTPSQQLKPVPMPSLPKEPIRYVPSAYDRFPSAPAQPEANSDETTSMLSARSITALALAALLGCVVGYLGYLQLPAPVIPIDVRPLNQTMIVSWPPDETRNAAYAAIRLNDGTPVPLSAQEKKDGQVVISAAKDFKVEVIAQNWARDSRGIVHYMRSNNPSAQAAPVDAPPSL